MIQVKINSKKCKERLFVRERSDRTKEEVYHAAIARGRMAERTV